MGAILLSITMHKHGLVYSATTFNYFQLTNFPIVTIIGVKSEYHKASHTVLSLKHILVE